MKGQIKGLVFLPQTRLSIVPPGVEIDLGSRKTLSYQGDRRSQSLGELHAVNRFSCVHQFTVNSHRVKAAEPKRQWPLRLRP